jgi:hypothetical protein
LLELACCFDAGRCCCCLDVSAAVGLPDVDGCGYCSGAWVTSDIAVDAAGDSRVWCGCWSKAIRL